MKDNFCISLLPLAKGNEDAAPVPASLEFTQSDGPEAGSKTFIYHPLKFFVEF